MMKSNILLNQDSISFIKNLPDDSIDFILTDPPYYIAKEVSIIRRSNEMKFKGKDISLETAKWDMIWKNRDEYKKWLFSILNEFYRILKPYRHCVVFVDKLLLGYVMEYWKSLGGKYRRPVGFIKTNSVPCARKVSPMTTLELAFWGTKGEAKTEFFNWKLGMHRDIIEVAIPNKEGCEIRHETQKPLFVGLYFTALFSKPNDLCLDPFAGVMTFPLAFKLLKRRYIGIEKDKKYFQAGKRRLEEELQNRAINRIYQKFLQYMNKKKYKKWEEDFNYLLGLDKIF